jgi:putative glycosyltransferase (TIGR04372 family)
VLIYIATHSLFKGRKIIEFTSGKMMAFDSDADWARKSRLQVENTEMKLQKKNRRPPRWRRQRFAHLCFMFAGALLNVLPRRLAFRLLMICDVIGLRGRRRLEQAYHPYVVIFLANYPCWRFSERASQTFPGHSARVLFGIGAYREASDLISAEGLSVHSSEMTKLLARALFELGEFKKARDAVSLRSSEVESLRDPDLAFLKGMVDIIDGDEAAAVESVSRARRGVRQFMRPHQNIAARSSRNYVPNSLDRMCGPPGWLFDLCNFTGQRVTHVGHGDIGVRLYERALAAQLELHNLPPPKLSRGLNRLLDDLGISFKELRIIPEEWTTQIGHLGLLDILFRMRELGWWSGKPLMVVRSGLIANAAFFRLFERFGKVLVIQEDATDLGEELLSLQRWCGLNFNAFRLRGGKVVAWQEAGALAVEQWEREGRGYPLRQEYDRIFGPSKDINVAFQRMRERWQMKPDDWYVCLHTRDASYYFELAGTGQTHRNSPIEAYLDAIRFITGKGGWVIKLGGPNSPRLPMMDRTIDYAQSEFKSDLMDIHLIRNARAFVGTTSGLTNVALGFGIPSAIVNCITTDSQPWNKNVRLVLKPIHLADGRMLTQRQLTSSPWRWRVFDAAVLARHGGHPVNNSADEILEAVREVSALASGRSAEFEKDYDAGRLWERWQEQLTIPYYFGAAKPSLYYLKKYEKEFLG